MNKNNEKKWSAFPKEFWTANVIELFERGAYYAIASFVVIYLNETLGMAPARATFLNGTLLWGLLYFLPILSGTLADRFGFRRSLIFAFVCIALGYLIMGTVQNFWPVFTGTEGKTDFAVPIIAGILFIGIGGSFVKPCISGTVQKTSGAYSTLGFGIFYMTINIGSMLGRMVSYFVRVSMGIPAIFTHVAVISSLVGLLIVFFIFREPRYQDSGAAGVKPRSLSDALLGMVTVLKNSRFVFFLIVISFFWFIYVQIYNLIPLFLRFIDPDAAVEMYTIVNPVMIVLFQLIITRLSQNWSDLRSIMAGIGITVAGVLVNIVPFLSGMDIFQKISCTGIMIPIGGMLILFSIASMAVGEMFASPRIYRYIGAIAPRGQEGLYLGYANLPLALGTIVGGPVGGILFQEFVSKPHKAGMPLSLPMMWLIVAGMGVISILGVLFYDRLMKQEHS